MSRETINRILHRAFKPEDVWETVADYKIDRHRTDGERQEIQIFILHNTELGYTVLATDSKRSLFEESNPSANLQEALLDMNWRVFDGPSWADKSY